MADTITKKKKKSGAKNLPQKAETSVPSNAASNASKSVAPAYVTSDDQSNSEDLWQAFEVELKWCIDKLQNQLSSTKQSQKQSEDTLRLIKSLSNKKAPLVKKRQIMRKTFGDYRLRMKDEEQEFKKSLLLILVAKECPLQRWKRPLTRAYLLKERPHSKQIPLTKTSFQM